MHRSGLVLVCVLVTCGRSAAQSPNPADLAIPSAVLAKAEEWVEQLGSEEYAKREEAERELAEMGRLARPALLRGANAHPSPEVRFRCARLLPAAVVLEMEARLDTFLADTRGEYEHDLPGWNEFRAVVRGEWSLLGYTIGGDRSLDESARKVFAELLSRPANRQLLMAMAGPSSDFRQAVAARRQELYYRKYPRVGGQESIDPSLDEMTALLFAESQSGSQGAPPITSISNLIQTSGFRDKVLVGKQPEVYRALALAWLASRTDPREMYYAMSIADNMNLHKQQVELSVRLLQTPNATTSYRRRAATNIAEYGTRE